MRSQSTTVDVVVPTYNGWSLTRSCLEHLRAQTVPRTVVVCDNASTDGTAASVREAFPDVRILELKENLGFAAACNSGVRESTGEIVVLLNNDVECRPDFLERLLAPLRSVDDVGSVAPLLVMPGEDRIDSVGLTVDPTLAGFPRLRGRPLPDADSRQPILLGPTGAAGAYRRRAWEEVGGLDEGVFAYGEDVDLALRLRAAGWSSAMAVDAIAMHRGSSSAGRRSAWQRRQGGFSRGYFLRRYGVLRGRAAPRALATEAIAVAGDSLLFSRDLAALRGRLAGWRAAAGLPRNPRPPKEVVDHDITFVESLRLRRRVYSCM